MDNINELKRKDKLNHFDNTMLCAIQIQIYTVTKIDIFHKRKNVQAVLIEYMKYIIYRMDNITEYKKKDLSL